jgi:hypothetical protein
VIAKTKARMPEYRAKRKAISEVVDDDFLDRKALQMLQAEGLR